MYNNLKIQFKLLYNFILKKHYFYHDDICKKYLVLLELGYSYLESNLSILIILQTIYIKKDNILIFKT